MDALTSHAMLFSMNPSFHIASPSPELEQTSPPVRTYTSLLTASVVTVADSQVIFTHAELKVTPTVTTPSTNHSFTFTPISQSHSHSPTNTSTTSSQSHEQHVIDVALPVPNPNCTNIHHMVTRGKAGIHKPKAYVTTTHDTYNLFEDESRSL